jgi:hypothetical protein
MYYSKINIKKEYPCGYASLFLKVKEHKDNYKKEDDVGRPILELKIPEPNFTMVLQGVKAHNGTNVWTDNVIEFSEIIQDVHVRVICLGKRLRSDQLKQIKGKNNA